VNKDTKFLKGSLALRFIIATGCLGIIILCCAVSIISLSKPGFVWTPLSEFLNDGKQTTIIADRSAAEVQQEILGQVTSVGENNIKVTEEQLTVLARQQLPQLRDLTVDIEQGILSLYWKLDQSENSIIANVDIGIDQSGKVSIKKIGTPKIALPESFNNAVAESVIQAITNSANQSEMTSSATNSFDPSMLQNLITTNENFQLKSINLENDYADLKVFLNIPL
jgi:hypothetical protein